MKDDELISLLWQRKEEAILHIRKQYSGIIGAILRKMLPDSRDVEECENDVLLAVWNSIPPQRPRSLGAYVSSLAKRTGIDRVRYNTRSKRASAYEADITELAEVLPDSQGPDTETDNQAIRECLNRFLQSLDGETQVLFVRRYFWSESVEELAARFELQENTVSVRLMRARKKLRAALEKEGVAL